MAKIFLALLFSALITGILAIPFINLLYRLKFQRQREYLGKYDHPVALIDKLHDWKAGTPSAGGLLVLLVATALGMIIYQFTSFKFNWTIAVLAITFLTFGLIGFYDDLRKFLELPKSGIGGVRAWQKLLLQIVFGVVVGYLLHFELGFDSIRLPFDVTWMLGPWYIVFAMLVIVTMANAFNITDGLDGLATGLLIIALCAYLYLAVQFSTPDVVVFIAVLLGSLLSFLYFNIYPARIWMGDTGSMAFGAALAVIALMSQNVFVLPVIGGVFMIELASSALQIASVKITGQRLFKIAPLHHHFEALGWTETKVTMRFWLFGAVCAFIGLWLALL
jgi:phospho-N-acetylmuramoyl-pentapeptide-transferase